jgi:hypothetical protein
MREHASEEIALEAYMAPRLGGCRRHSAAKMFQLAVECARFVQRCGSSVAASNQSITGSRFLHSDRA